MAARRRSARFLQQQKRRSQRLAKVSFLEYEKSPALQMETPRTVFRKVLQTQPIVSPVVPEKAVTPKRAETAFKIPSRNAADSNQEISLTGPIPEETVRPALLRHGKKKKIRLSEFERAVDKELPSTTAKSFLNNTSLTRSLQVTLGTPVTPPSDGKRGLNRRPKSYKGVNVMTFEGGIEQNLLQIKGSAENHLVDLHASALSNATEMIYANTELFAQSQLSGQGKTGVHDLPSEPASAGKSLSQRITLSSPPDLQSPQQCTGSDTGAGMTWQRQKDVSAPGTECVDGPEGVSKEKADSPSKEQQESRLAIEGGTTDSNLKGMSSSDAEHAADTEDAAGMDAEPQQRTPSLGREHQGSLHGNRFVEQQESPCGDQFMEQRGSLHGDRLMEQRGSPSRDHLMEKRGSLHGEHLMEKRGSLRGDRLMEQRGSPSRDHLMEKRGSLHGDRLMEKRGSLCGDRLMEQQGSPSRDHLMEKRGSLHGDRLMEKRGSLRGDRLMEQRGSPSRDHLMEKRGSLHGDRLMEKRGSLHGDRLMENRGSLRGDRLMEQQGSPSRDHLMEKQGSPHGDRLMEQRGSPHGDRLMEKQGSLHGDRLMEQRGSPHGDRLMEKQGSLHGEHLMENQGSPHGDHLMEQRGSPHGDRLMELHLSPEEHHFRAVSAPKSSVPIDAKLPGVPVGGLRSFKQDKFTKHSVKTIVEHIIEELDKNMAPLGVGQGAPEADLEEEPFPSQGATQISQRTGVGTPRKSMSRQEAEQVESADEAIWQSGDRSKPRELSDLEGEADLVSEAEMDCEVENISETEMDSENNEPLLKTPAFVRKKAFQCTPLLSTPHTLKPAASKSASKQPAKKQVPKVSKEAPREKRQPGISSCWMKKIFSHYAKMPVTKEAFPAVERCVSLYFKHLSDDLEAYANHARRKTIEAADLELLMRRQGLITDKTPLNVLIEHHLPLEYRKLLIPVATSGNKVIPLNL